MRHVLLKGALVRGCDVNGCSERWPCLKHTPQLGTHAAMEQTKCGSCGYHVCSDSCPRVARENADRRRHVSAAPAPRTKETISRDSELGLAVWSVITDNWERIETCGTVHVWRERTHGAWYYFASFAGSAVKSKIQFAMFYDSSLERGTWRAMEWLTLREWVRSTRDEHERKTGVKQAVAAALSPYEKDSFSGMVNELAQKAWPDWRQHVANIGTSIAQDHGACTGVITLKARPFVGEDFAVDVCRLDEEQAATIMADQLSAEACDFRGRVIDATNKLKELAEPAPIRKAREALKDIYQPRGQANPLTFKAQYKGSFLGTDHPGLIYKPEA